MNSIDRKLASVIKAALQRSKGGPNGERASKEFHHILKQVANPDLMNAVQNVFSDISGSTEKATKLEIAEALRLLRTFLDRGFREMPAVIFLGWLDSFRGLSLEQVLSVAPNTACFGKWIKATKIPVQEIERHLLDRPEQTYATVGADWMLEHAKPEVSLRVVGFFLARQPRPKYLLQWNEALAAAIKKDKRGELLAAIFRQPSPSQEQILALREAARSNRALLKAMGDLLPTILARKDSTAAAVGFVRCLFDNVITAEGGDREFATALLARLGTGILLADRRTHNSEEALDLICRITRQLRNLTKGATAQTKTWVLESLWNEENSSDGKVCVNLQGARYIALAFEKADQGFPAKDILAVTARYLGLSPIGKNGETVRYEPLQHEDVDGGLVPGESVVVLESGWALNEEAVKRAKVKRAREGSHV